MLVHRIPIKENGKVIAVFGLVTFKNIKDIGRLAAKLSELESQVKLYQKQLNSLRTTRYSFDSIIGKSQLFPSEKGGPAGRSNKPLGVDFRRIRHRQGTFRPVYS